MKFQFGNVVVVDNGNIGVIVKSWDNDTHDVYVRSYNGIKTYSAEKIQHYVYCEALNEEEYDFYDKS